MLIIDELNQTNIAHHHPNDLPLIESWIDFSECTILHSNSQFIKSNSNSNSISFNPNPNPNPNQPPPTSGLERSLVGQQQEEGGPEQFIKPTLDQSTTPSTSSSLTSPFCDRASFLTLSPPPICLNDPLPITRTEYGLMDEFWSHISTREHGLGVEESDGILKFGVHVQEDGTEEEEGFRRNRSIELPIQSGITQSSSRIDPLLLSMNDVHQLQPNPSSTPDIKLDVDEILHGFDHFQYHPHPHPQAHPQATNEDRVFEHEPFERNPESRSPTHSISSSSHSSNQTQDDSISPSNQSKSFKPNQTQGSGSRVGKRKEFLERNRLAASRSRAKRKQTESMLESRARVLEDQNSRLRRVVEELEFEVRDLKQVLLDVRMMG